LGAARGSQLTHEWSLIPDKGRGTGALNGSAYEGRLGVDAADTGEGAVFLIGQR
jgi:hypothetical protein